MSSHTPSQSDHFYGNESVEVIHAAFINPDLGAPPNSQLYEQMEKNCELMVHAFSPEIFENADGEYILKFRVQLNVSVGKNDSYTRSLDHLEFILIDNELSLAKREYMTFSMKDMMKSDGIGYVEVNQQIEDFLAYHPELNKDYFQQTLRSLLESLMESPEVKKLQTRTQIKNIDFFRNLGLLN